MMRPDNYGPPIHGPYGLGGSELECGALRTECHSFGKAKKSHIFVSAFVETRSSDVCGTTRVARNSEQHLNTTWNVLKYVWTTPTPATAVLSSKGASLRPH